METTALASVVRDVLRASASTVAIAESTCGGLVSYLVGDTIDAGQLVRAGVVVYSNDAKRDLARVPPETLTAHGAVSTEVALALARGVRAYWDADWGIAETGIAGPIGQRRSRKSAGVAILAIVGRPHGTDGPVIEVTQNVTSGLDNRIANKRAFAHALLRFFAEVLARTPNTS